MPLFAVMYRPLTLAQELQQKGYFGDGMWSNGKRLSDGAAIQGEGVQAGVDVPEQLCGGASKISKKRRYRRRRPTSTGSPTKRRKAGGRIRRKDAFVGDGQAVSADPAQSSFRRRTQSKAGGEARAVAAERRARHEARRQRGEPSDTDAAPDDEEDGLESEGDGGEKPLFRDEGSTTEEEDEDIEVSAEDKRWLKKEASDALLDDFWQKYVRSRLPVAVLSDDLNDGTDLPKLQRARRPLRKARTKSPS